MVTRVQPATRLYKAHRPIATTCITFVDDDGKAEVWEKIKAAAEEKGIPFVLSLVNDWQELTQNQCLYMQNVLGFEIASHSYTHANLNLATPEELEVELLGSKNNFISRGYNVENIVYPWGEANASVQTEVAKYYNCGAATLVGINTRPVSTYYLKRVALGAFADPNTLDFYKAKIDEAISNSGWLIFMLHVSYVTHDATQQDYLLQTIEYAKEQGVRIVTLQQGYEAFL